MDEGQNSYSMMPQRGQSCDSLLDFQMITYEYEAGSNGQGAFQP